MGMVVRWKKCLSEPKQVLKLVAIIICLCVACYQLSECFYKILHPPISTHYNFQLNETLSFPSLTICRNPPYKTSVFSKYGLSSGGPKYPSAWRNFSFSLYTMDQFFDEATYSFTEVIPFYGFDKQITNVITSSFINVEYGRCFVFTPINESTVWSSTGYFFYLYHSETTRKVGTYGLSLSGYHVHIHDRKDVYAGSIINDNSLTDYIYIENGEEVRLNLKVKIFEQLPRKENYCNDTYYYSQSKCEADCLFKRLTEEAGCSTPWLANENLPQCNNYTQTYKLIKLYDTRASQYIKECACPRECHLRVYSSYLENRRDVQLPKSELAITFSANLVTMMKEVLGYDWNLFISDLGGSLGFLLGISVIGVIGTLENVIEVIRKNNEQLVFNKPAANDALNESIDGSKLDIESKGWITKIKFKRDKVSDVNQYTPQKETHDFVPTKY